MDCLSFLQSPPTAPLPVYVVTGDDGFLKRQALVALRERILGPGEDSFGLASYPGDQAQFAEIRSELETVPFLAERRLVIVEQADPFVTRYRSYLEKYLTRPATEGTLVLEAKTWPANTKLAKALPDAATIVCKAPAGAKLAKWCVEWAKQQHGKQLTQPAAQLLVDLVGSEMGLLDQELAKLASYAGKAARIDAGDVDLMVGRSQGDNAFLILNAMAGGQAGEALTILDHLFTQGEEPLRIFGALTWQLRRIAQAARLSQSGASLYDALGQVGFHDRRSGEQILRHLGSGRANQLFDLLLEMDLALKGSSQLPPRMLLEQFVVRLSRPREGTAVKK
jgi:DNA polymerase-3 subunit delta